MGLPGQLVTALPGIRPRVTVHAAIGPRGDGEALSLQRALFAVRVFGLLVVVGFLAISLPVDRTMYGAAVAVLGGVLTMQLLWFRSGRLDLASAVALAGLVGDSLTGYLVGQSSLGETTWTSYIAYPLIAMEGALVFGARGALGTTLVSSVVYVGQELQRAQQGAAVEPRMLMAVLATYLLYGVFLTISVGIVNRTRGNLRVLLDVAGLLSAQESLAGIVQRLDERLSRLVGARVRSIAIRRPDGTYEVQRWRTTETRTMSADTLGALSAIAGRDVEAETREGRALTLRLRSTDDGALRADLDVPDWVRALTIVPISSEGVLIGILPVLWDQPRVPSPGEMELLRGLADQTGLAFGQAQARRSRELAATDSLTGLANHRAFRDALAARVSEAKRHGGRLAILFTDLDRFKPVNDRHGHAVGDLLLHRIAQAVRAAARTEDLVARYGGDEFALILPGADGAAAEEVARRLREEVRRAESGLGIDLTVGVARYPEDAADAETLVDRADAAMYAGKRLGGGRVVHASQAGSAP